MSTPTLPRCARRYGRSNVAFAPRSLDDVREVLFWQASDLVGEMRRRAAVRAVLWWLAELELEQADREAGCVALLREAAVLVGQGMRRKRRPVDV